MARIIDDSALTGPARRKASYPWDEWFDGRTRELVRGEDFTISTSAFARSAYAAAVLRGKRARISVLEDRILLRAEKRPA
jgi:hypothetical protein